MSRRQRIAELEAQLDRTRDPRDRAEIVGAIEAIAEDAAWPEPSEVGLDEGAMIGEDRYLRGMGIDR